MQEDYTSNNLLRIDMNKPIDLPRNIISVDTDLIIAPDIPSWITLSSEIQRFIFNKFIKRRTIAESLNECSKRYSYKECLKSVSNILVQIHVKKFLNGVNKQENKFLEKMKIYITNACNLRCVHCFIRADMPLPNELTTNEIKKLINNFSNYGGKILTITGGEPLVRRDIFEILKFAKDNNLFVVLLTNGTLVNENNANQLVKYVDQIQISIDGPNEETHDAIRGVGTFKKTMKAIHLLGNTNVDIFISMTPVPRFIPDINSFLRDFPKFVDEMKKYQNIRAINVNLVLLPGRMLSNEDIDVYTKFSQELTFKYLKNENEFNLNFLHLNKKITSCGYAEVLTVLPNGDIKPCYPSPTVVGNIRDNEFIDIVTELKTLFNLNLVDKIQTCSTCPLRYFCGGWCRLKLKFFHVNDYKDCEKAKVLIDAMKTFDSNIIRIVNNKVTME